jgi:hypothetical protein
MICVLKIIIQLAADRQPARLIDKYNQGHHPQMMMTWFDMYNEFIKNFEKMTQLQKDYVENLQCINYMYNEFIKSIVHETV